MKTCTFTDYLLCRIGEDSAIGDLARLVAGDPLAPNGSSHALWRHLLTSGASAEALEAFAPAEADWYAIFLEQVEPPAWMPWKERATP